MRFIRVVAILAMLGLSGACGWVGGSDPPAELPLTLETTGGVAGVQTVLTVDTTGAWTFTNRKGGATTSTGQLTSDQLSTVRRLLADRGLVNTPPKRNTRCADYFVYSLTAVHRAVRTGECGETAPAVQALISYLREATTSG